MDPFDQLADRLSTLSVAVRQEMVGLVSIAGALLLQFNQDYLAKEGRRPDGEPIQETGYSPAYAAYKKKYGKFTNTAFVDLKFSGDFLASFVLEYEGGGSFRIVATDKKAAFLTKYGELLGLREADIQDFVTTVLEPGLRRFARNYMRP
jgi:hypothetical protein